MIYSVAKLAKVVDFVNSIILTVAGKKKVDDELEYLKNVTRVEIKEALKVARAQGDLSENADYSAAKDDQALNETRIQDLEATLKNSIVVEDEDADENTFVLNKRALIKFYDVDEEEIVTLVSSVEADAKHMRISIDSPLGKVLYRLQIGIKKTVQSPDGDYDVEIMKIL